MDIDRTEHGGYRREVASKLGLCGNGRMTNEKPIKRATGGSIPKFATGGALKKLGHAMRHDISNAARKTRGAFKEFGHKEKEGFESIGRKIKTDVIDKSRRGFQEHVAQPTRKAAATAKNMAREIGHDINTKAIKPTGRYLRESAKKDEEPKMANGGRTPPPPKYTYAEAQRRHRMQGSHLPPKPGERGYNPPTQPRTAVMPPQDIDRSNQIPPNAQPWQDPAPMKKGGKACKMRMGGVHGFPGPHKTPKAWKDGGHIGDLKIGSGKRVKANVQTRHNFQNVGRMLTGKEEKSVYGAKERRERKEAGLPRMAHGGVGKLRHGVTPKTGIVSSKWKDKDLYM